jgi:hypothetical protein
LRSVESCININSAIFVSSRPPSRLPGPILIGAEKFPTYHKKPNVQFVRDSQAQAKSRNLAFKEKVKENRSKAVNSRRGITDSIMEGESVLENKPTTAEKIKSTRLEQLQRWKKEKEQLTQKRV